MRSSTEKTILSEMICDNLGRDLLNKAVHGQMVSGGGRLGRKQVSKLGRCIGDLWIVDGKPLGGGTQIGRQNTCGSP